jgi:hypothetical protein
VGTRASGFSRGTARVLGCCCRPRAARAVLSCAGVAYMPPASGNVCPEGSVKRLEEDWCRATVLAMAGYTLNDPFSTASTSYPLGCQVWPFGKKGYYNTVGDVGHPSHQIVCAGIVTPGAPPHADARARVCTGACSGTARLCNVTRSCRMRTCTCAHTVLTGSATERVLTGHSNGTHEVL